jgi:geranylgeranyl diphosphate synthase, type I
MDLSSFYEDIPIIEKKMEEIIPRDSHPKEVYGLIWEFLDLGGKRFRPMLCLQSSLAVGGKKEDSLYAATAIELFHNFTLVHDDIEDDSKMRRGKDCLHIKYGIPLAINSGDGLFMMVWRCALKIQSPRLLEAQSILLDAFSKVLEGQGMELCWHKDNSWDITEEDYFKMIGGKTAALIRASSHVGALLGGGTDEQCNALAEYGEKIGLAFQIQDDLLNLIGDEHKYKKEIGGDIAEGKRTLMVIHCLDKLNPTDKQRMKEILGTPGAKRDEIQWCIEKLKSTGSLDYALEYADSLVSQALNLLQKIPDSQTKNLFVSVAKYMVKREE